MGLGFPESPTPGRLRRLGEEQRGYFVFLNLTLIEHAQSVLQPLLLGTLVSETSGGLLESREGFKGSPEATEVGLGRGGLMGLASSAYVAQISTHKERIRLTTTAADRRHTPLQS